MYKSQLSKEEYEKREAALDQKARELESKMRPLLETVSAAPDNLLVFCNRIVGAQGFEFLERGMDDWEIKQSTSDQLTIKRKSGTALCQEEQEIWMIFLSNFLHNLSVKYYPEGLFKLIAGVKKDFTESLGSECVEKNMELHEVFLNKIFEIENEKRYKETPIERQKYADQSVAIIESLTKYALIDPSTLTQCVAHRLHVLWTDEGEPCPISLAQAEKTIDLWESYAFATYVKYPGIVGYMAENMSRPFYPHVYMEDALDYTRFWDRLTLSLCAHAGKGEKELKEVERFVDFAHKKFEEIYQVVVDGSRLSVVEASVEAANLKKVVNKSKKKPYDSEVVSSVKVRPGI